MNNIALILCISSCTKSTGSSVAVTNSFPPGAFPEYRLNCTQLSNGAWHCIVQLNNNVSALWSLELFVKAMKIYTMIVLNSQ